MFYITCHSLPWIMESAVFSASLQTSGERNSQLHMHMKIGWDLQTQTFGRWHNLTWVSMIGRSKHNAGSCSSKVPGKLAELWSSPCCSLWGALLDISSLYNTQNSYLIVQIIQTTSGLRKGARIKKWRWPDPLTGSQWNNDTRCEVT